MEKAIKRAIEGGYKNHLLEDDEITRIDMSSAFIDGKYYIHFINGYNNESDMFAFSLHETLLDPEFYKCLGKAEFGDGDIQRYQTVGNDGGLIPRWQYEWHNFIDHLANGGDINSFFEKILK